MVASEATPYAKTGGLADVIGSLPAALQGRGEEVAVVLPLYRQSREPIAHADRAYDNLRIPMGPTDWVVDIRRVVNAGVQFYFVQNTALYDRPELYTEAGVDYPDNHIRFAVLCRAALGVTRYLFRPDVIHYHDWQASLIAPLIRREFRLDPTFYGIKLLLTIHNLGYQGLFPRTALDELAIDKALFHPDALEFYGGLNLLKGGIVFADAINTVSRGYANEIQTPEHGFGLDGLLRRRAGVLSGIVNGVDYNEWSPEVDKFAAAHYSLNDFSGKRACKLDLLRTFGLPASRVDKPLIGMVSRFVGQKGFDLIADIADELVLEDVSITAIGTGEPRYEQLLTDLAANHPEKVSIRVGYDNAIAHKIEAGADMFLMPSRYEPCGLNQIYSLRYGTVPIVRATGGLDDTIEESTGFKFREYSGAALMTAIRAALRAYDDRKLWGTLVRNGMSKDFSWSASAAEYSRLYRQLTS